MTMMEFFGCAFIAFGPALALFIFTIAVDPLRIIVFVASAFFWLLSLLLSAGWWKAVVPLQDHLVFGLVFSVIFQEVFRFLFYLLLRKAEDDLSKFWPNEDGANTMSLMSNKRLLAYVAVLGFGVISGAFSLVNVVADMAGPGTVGLMGDSQQFFITSSFLTLCFIFLHVFWGVLFYNGLRHRKYYQNAAVVLCHMLVSCLTLLNQGHSPIYPATLVPAYALLCLMGVWAFVVSGGNLANIRLFCCSRGTASYDL